MVIIKVYGGLGNQLFQWALYRKIKALGKEAAIDISAYEKGKEKRPFYLDKIDERISYCSSRMRKRYADYDNIFFQKILGNKKTHYHEKQFFVFDDNVFHMNNVYLDGYWQNEAYFKDIKKEITDILLAPSLIYPNNEIINMIHDENSVAVHVRRGDYLEHPNIYGQICTPDYYEKAIEFVRDRVENPMFFVFSDDLKWCREAFKEQKNFIFVEPVGEPYADMRLMSMCKYDIVANSSFSWWAAWLNGFSDKFVVSPNKWVYYLEEKDIICDDWITIS